MLLPVVLFVAGLVLMIYGADLLVRGASRLALMIGITPLVVGLTVVAFGTSAPEFAVSFKAALSGQASLSVGNVVGSNIFNVLFILGISASLVPLLVAPQLIRFDMPLVVAASVCCLVLGWDGSFGRLDGVLLFTGLCVYIWTLIRSSRKEQAVQLNSVDAPDITELKHTGRSKAVQVLIQIGLVVVGLAMLVVGANWFVDSAVTFARWMEVSELVIGLTIVAAGTSMPEVVTSIVASLKGERDIAVGNVVGSNIFNILGVLGLSGIVAPAGLEVSAQAIRFDIPVMIAVVVVAWPMFMTGKVISRWEGLILLAGYVAYTAYLIMNAAPAT